eukprot:Skav208748  [mRNA]  locus=scaffold1871:27747:36612:+ [translate_table: standard]
MVARCKAAGLLKAICTWPCNHLAENLSKRLLSTLSLLLTFNDECVLINASEALAMLPHSDPQHLAVLLMRGTIERLVFLLEQPSDEVRGPVCRALQRIACASKTGMQALLVCEPLPALKELMESDEPSLQLESTVHELESKKVNAACAMDRVERTLSSSAEGAAEVLTKQEPSAASEASGDPTL